MGGLREKLKKKQREGEGGGGSSVWSRYDFNILWYFLISYFSILVLARFFLVYLLIGVDVIGHSFVL